MHAEQLQLGVSPEAGKTRRPRFWFGLLPVIIEGYRSKRRLPGGSREEKRSHVRAHRSQFPASGFAAAADIVYRLLKTVPVSSSGGWDYLSLLMIRIAASMFRMKRKLKSWTPDWAAAVGKISNTLGVHGIAIAPELGRGFTSNGKMSSVTIFDLKTLAVISQVPTGKKPDAIVFDPPRRARLRHERRGTPSRTAIDAVGGKVVGTIDLGGEQFTTVDGAGNVFVNIEDDNLTLHIDSRNLTVKDRWPLAPCKAPSSMGIRSQKW